MNIKKLNTIQIQKVEAGDKTKFQVLISDDEAPNFAMRRFIIDPGGSMPRHTNTVEHEQFVLNGKAEVSIGDKVYQVEKNDIVFIGAGKIHGYVHTGIQPFEFLCMVPNKEDSIKISNQ